MHNSKYMTGDKKNRALLISPAFCFLFFTFYMLSVSSVFSAEKIEFTLTDAVTFSLRENLSLSEEKLNPWIAEAEIIFQKGEFDPKLELKINESFRKFPSASNLTGTEDRALIGTISLGGKVSAGTKYSLSWENERIWSNSPFLRLNPYYSTELIITMTQPILKGLGRDIQESNLDIAKNNFEISRLNLDDKSMNIIAETSMAYWNLANARYNLEVAELSLKLALNLLAEVKAKIDSGVLAPVEIYKAEAEASFREEALLRAKKNVFDSEDKLRAVMNLKDWSGEIIPIEKIPIPPSDIEPVESAVNTAFSNRRDYKQALLEYQNKEILRRYFDNQRYPDLNISGSAGLNALNRTYRKAIDDLGSRDNYSWQLGISLIIPIGNRLAEGNYLKAKNEEEKSRIALKLIEQKITLETREAHRSVQLAIETIKASKKSRIAAEKRLEAEEARFKAGMATLNDVLKFQKEYTDALSSEKGAEIDYAVAVIKLEKTKGTLGL